METKIKSILSLTDKEVTKEEPKRGKSSYKIIVENIDGVEQLAFDVDNIEHESDGSITITKNPTVEDDLGERQKLVYKHLLDGKQYTAKELSMLLFDKGLVASHERNSVHPRLRELVLKKLVKVVGKKTCQYTNRSVSIYQAI